MAPPTILVMFPAIGSAVMGFCKLLLIFVNILDDAEDQREFNYEEDSEKGPARWGELRQEWSMCSKGSIQSPIDLLDDRVELVSNLGILKSNYRPSNATLKNRGHDMMVR